MQHPKTLFTVQGNPITFEGVLRFRMEGFAGSLGELLVTEQSRLGAPLASLAGKERHRKLYNSMLAKLSDLETLLGNIERMCR